VNLQSILSLATIETNDDVVGDLKLAANAAGFPLEVESSKRHLSTHGYSMTKYLRCSYGVRSRALSTSNMSTFRSTSETERCGVCICIKQITSTQLWVVDWIRNEHTTHPRLSSLSLLKSLSSEDQALCRELSEQGLSPTLIARIISANSDCHVTRRQVEHVIRPSVDSHCSQLLEFLQNSHNIRYIVDSTLSTSHTSDSSAGPRSAIAGNWDCFEKDGSIHKLISCAWVYTDALRQAILFPEVCVGDGVACTNNRRRPLYNVVCVGSNGQNIVFFEALLFDQTFATYTWLFQVAFPYLTGSEFCKRIQMFVVDNDHWQVGALEGVCGGLIYPFARVRLCAFHLITQPLRKLALCLSGRSTDLSVARSLSWRLLSCESEAEFEVTMLELESHLATCVGRVKQVETFCASLRANKSKYAGHFFLPRVTLGLVPSSNIEANHAVMKRAISLGGAGVSSKLAPEQAARNLYSTNSRRMTENVRVMDNATRNCQGMKIVSGTNSHLTPHAADLIKSEMECRTQITLRAAYGNELQAVESHRRYKITLCDDNRLRCSCAFSTQLLLPCRHVLAAKKNVDVGDVHFRWLLPYWKGDFRPDWHCSYPGAVANAESLALFNPGIPRAVTTTAQDEVGYSDNFDSSCDFVV